MRVKIIKSQGQYKKGDIVEVSKNIAFGLTDSGVGEITKDMTKQDIKVKSDEEQADGKHTKLRVNKFK